MIYVGLQQKDRKGQVAGMTYDALGRRHLVSFADASNIESTYHAGNRLTGLVDSVNGTLTWAYDNLDRITAASGPQGAVSYSYDSAVRRTGMTPGAQAAVSYTYDAANRLTTLVQGSETVQLAYDSANRRTQLTLPNGVKVNYGYDAANELTALTYAQASGTTLGNLTYGYDTDGRMIAKGGSFATDVRPSATARTMTFDLNDRVKSLNGQALSYDANGDLISDGVNTYTWNARNQLASITQNGAAQMSYVYDAMGRRISKVVQGGTPTQFLYDGDNIMQEMQGSAINRILVGLGVDERFARNDVTGRTYFLTDAL